MMQLQGLIALDLARERSREAARLAEGRRIHDLLAEEIAHHPALFASRPGIARRITAALLYRVEGGAAGVARAACAAAARLDGTAA